VRNFDDNAYISELEDEIVKLKSQPKSSLSNEALLWKIDRLQRHYDIIKEMEQMGFIEKANHVVVIIIINNYNNRILRKLTKYNNKFPW
jgi:hypothetical protein